MSSNRLVSVVIPVFNDGERAMAAAEAMLRQALPDGHRLEVLLVDDGSTDGSSARLRAFTKPHVRTLSLACNSGRSVARNAGVAGARGEFIVFMDCDCIPADGYVAAHVAALARRAVASTGHVDGADDGFWSSYQSEASERRRRQHRAGMPYAGSSQNLAVRRSTFDAVGGFDSGYQRYGFEDRELLLRLSEHGQITWSEGAVVSHRDALTLAAIAAKMAEAGQYSAGRFRDRNPDAYKRLGYAAIDVRNRPWLTAPAGLLAPIATATAKAFDATSCARWLPYRLASWLAKSIAAAAYLGGTAKAR